MFKLNCTFQEMGTYYLKFKTVSGIEGRLWEAWYSNKHLTSGTFIKEMCSK